MHALKFHWSDGVCCDLCNPAALAEHETPGAVVRGPTWQREICMACITALESLAVGDASERPLEPETVDVFNALGGARYFPRERDAAACACGQDLEPRSVLERELGDALQILLRAPRSRSELAVARAMFTLLRVKSFLSRCATCTDRNLDDAVNQIVAGVRSEQAGRNGGDHGT